MTIIFKKQRSEEVEVPEIADLSTKDFADILGVKPDTVRRGLCVNGHYLGIKPVKLPNGHNRWPGKPARALVEVSS